MDASVLVLITSEEQSLMDPKASLQLLSASEALRGKAGQAFEDAVHQIQELVRLMALFRICSGCNPRYAGIGIGAKQDLTRLLLQGVKLQLYSCLEDRTWADRVLKEKEISKAASQGFAWLSSEQLTCAGSPYHRVLRARLDHCCDLVRESAGELLDGFEIKPPLPLMRRDPEVKEHARNESYGTPRVERSSIDALIETIDDCLLNASMVGDWAGVITKEQLNGSIECDAGVTPPISPSSASSSGSCSSSRDKRARSWGTDNLWEMLNAAEGDDLLLRVDRLLEETIGILQDDSIG
ncbi:unnamed protein product [Chrysoparadoxa australica]